MIIQCTECDKIIELDLPAADVKRWRNGEMIQDVFPQLSVDDRELMISQMCGKCFDLLFADEIY